MNFPLKSIQILRGFAATAVLLYHLDIQWQQFFNRRIINFEYGELGVDFFFALSGFIITYVHFNDIGRPVNVKYFLAKRFIRIFPFYWLAMIAAVAIDPGKFGGWVLFIKNLLLFRLPIAGMVLGVAWSLTYEIVFYFLFAIAIAVGWKFARFMIAAWVILILVNVGDIFSGSVLLQVLANNVIVEFLFGCAAGYLFLNRNFIAKEIWLAAATILSLGLVLLLFYFDMNRFSLPVVAALGFASATVIYFAGTLDKKRKLFTPAALVLVGDASYAIYLTHTIYIPYILKAAKYSVRFLNSEVVVFLFVLAASVGMGIVVHLLIEKPVLLFFRKIVPHRKHLTVV